MNSIEKILSFDVGIIHLAYCLLTKNKQIINDKPIYKWDIIEWGIIDLTDRDEIKCCVCGKVATLIQNSSLKYYCKTHGKQINQVMKPYEECFTSLKENKGCQYNIKGGKCNKNCHVINNLNNEKYCNQHAKQIYKTLSNDIKLKSVKIKGVNKMDFDDTRFKLLQILESKKELLQADTVVIENQPSFKNPRMKSISALLYDFYLIRGILDKEITKSNIKKVKFMSPSNKIKLASDGETQQITKLKSTDESKAYKLTKSLAVKYCLDLLNHLPKWIEKFNSYKKKDDLADAFLQGAYYFEMNVKLDNDILYYKNKNIIV